MSGTLGEQQRVALRAGEPSSTSVIGQVQALEGGAYLIQDAQGREVRIPHDENTRSTDRPMWATAFKPGSIAMAAPS